MWLTNVTPVSKKLSYPNQSTNIHKQRTCLLDPAIVRFIYVQCSHQVNLCHIMLGKEGEASMLIQCLNPESDAYEYGPIHVRPMRRLLKKVWSTNTDTETFSRLILSYSWGTRTLMLWLNASRFSLGYFLCLVILLFMTCFPTIIVTLTLMPPVKR